ncbi:MAG: BsuPI-related putative proteinase inhibitor [Armatimonadota bacterium]|nr:BsuPI-related putative proteinase inhibitor [Armatimonadota bacterium]MDW8156681.1 BsuPI-related putative proteinase inhibitor [Armatimonadota bacterium]
MVRRSWWCAVLLAAVVALPAWGQIFSDVAGRPEQRMLEKLAAKGVFPIPQDRRFQPDEPITRLDFFVALARAVGLREGGGTLPEYRDAQEIPSGARGLLAALASAGTVNQRKAVRKVQEWEVILEADKGTYGPGEEIGLVLSVRNTAGRVAELEFATSQQYDFVIRSPSGEEVARWSLGRQFTTQGMKLRVDPNQQVVVGEGRWKQLDQNDRPVPPGRYELVGVVTARPQPMTVTIFFSKGFVTSFPDNTFRPRGQLTRAEVAELVARVSGLEQEALAKRGNPIPAQDAQEVKPEHRGYVALALERKFLVASDGRVRPNAPATRLDAAVALDGVMNALGRYNFVRGRFRGIQPGNPTILSITDGPTIRNFRLGPVVAVYRNDRPAQLQDLKPNDELAMLLLGDVGDVTYVEAKGP